MSECVHGHKVYTVGCVSCVLLHKQAQPAGCQPAPDPQPAATLGKLLRRVRLGKPKGSLPSKPTSTRGSRRVLSVTLTDSDAAALERLRVETGAQSWGAVIRALIGRAALTPQEPRP